MTVLPTRLVRRGGVGQEVEVPPRREVVRERRARPRRCAREPAVERRDRHAAATQQDVHVLGRGAVAVGSAQVVLEDDDRLAAADGLARAP